MGRTTSIIEFGTSKIVCMSGTILKDETAEVHSVARVPYPGIKNGNWVDAKAVLPALEKAVIQIEQEMRRNIRQVFVGVPGCYTEIALETKEIFIDDGKVQNRHIDELLASEPPDTGKEFEVIDSRPVYFIDSRENIYVQPPVDISTEKLTVQMAFTGAFRPFLEDIEHLLADLKIQVVDFLPEKLAQALCIVPQAARDGAAILVDVGYFDTDVSLIYGDAVMAKRTIHAGGAQIAGDLRKVLGIDHVLAENLKRSYIFGLDASEDMRIYAKDKDRKMRSFSQQMIKEIIETRVVHLISMISKEIKSFRGMATKQTPVFLTGGGLAMQKGCIPFFEKTLGRKSYSTSIRNVKLNAPYFHTAISLLDNTEKAVYYLKSEAKKASFVGKLKNIFFTNE